MQVLLKRIFKFLSSLKLAVIILILLTASLAAATFIESIYDIPTGRYWVYDSFFFKFVLFLLGVLIFCVAMSRLPWKKRHIPFLLAHLGILLLLFGSWVTQRSGLDAQVILEEGQSQARVQLNDLIFNYEQKGKSQTIEIPWKPSHVKFSPINISDQPLVIDQFLTHAELKPEFTESQNQSDHPAIYFYFEVPGMGFKKRIWLYAGDSSWSFSDIGPAQFVLYPNRKNNQKPFVYETGHSFYELFGETNKARIEFQFDAKGKLHYRVTSLKGQSEVYRYDGAKILKTQWKGPMGSPEVSIKKAFRFAVNESTAIASRIQYGDQAPPSAIRVSSGEHSVWLREGEKASLGDIQMSYGKRGLVLPFGLLLDRFSVVNYPGSQQPASFSSLVRVLDADAPNSPQLIEMNEPLKWRGYTFYQSSYIPGEPRATVSILTVNQDPGRELKYFGSILIVLGSILLFLNRYLKFRFLC